MWWWHQQHFWTQNVDTVNILGSGSIGYVMDAYRICCLAFPTYFFRTEREADATRAGELPYKFNFQIFKLRNIGTL